MRFEGLNPYYQPDNEGEERRYHDAEGVELKEEEVARSEQCRYAQCEDEEHDKRVDHGRGERAIVEEEVGSHIVELGSAA